VNHSPLFDPLDDVLLNALSIVFGTMMHTALLQLTSSVAEGGCGFFSYRCCASSLYSASYTACFQIVRHHLALLKIEFEKPDLPTHLQPSCSIIQHLAHQSAIWKSSLSPVQLTKALSLPNDDVAFFDMHSLYPTTKISNAAFRNQLLIHLDILPPSAIRCCDGPLSSSEFIDHILTCHQCIGKGADVRHELVNTAIQQACHVVGIHYSTNPLSLPLPGAQSSHGHKSGPDGILHFADRPAFDVSIAHHSANNGSRFPAFEHRYLVKQNLYIEWTKLTNIRCIPFTLSTLGRFHKQSLTPFHEASKLLRSARLLRLIKNFVLAALAEGNYALIRLAMARSSLLSQQT
jgi:hypothetical protein